MNVASTSRPAAGIALVLLGACSSGASLRQESEDTRNRFTDYAGPPVDRFVWFGRYNGWEAVGRNQLVLWTGVNDAWLITVWPGCRDLRFVTNRIGLSSTGGSVYARFDSIMTRDWRCRIDEIRPVDYRRMKADMRAARQQQQAPK